MQTQLDGKIDLVANMSQDCEYFTFDFNAAMLAGVYEIWMLRIRSLGSWICIKRNYITTINSIRINIRV